MTEQTLLYIVLIIAAVSALAAVFLLMNNRGLNSEINSMVNAYQNLSKQVDEIKQHDMDMIRTLENSLNNFGGMISENQKNSAENMDKRLFELNTRFSHMAVENEQKLENIRNTMENKIKSLTEDNNKQLEQMRQTVDEKLQKTLEDRISQSFKRVSEQLEQVYKGLGEIDRKSVV